MEQVDLASEAGTDCEDKMSHASTYEAESEMAEAIAAIVDRIRQDDFPLVLTSEQRSMSPESAQEVLAWVQKVDFVLLKSYLEQRYQEYRAAASHTKDLATSEEVFRAEWATSMYVNFKKGKMTHLVLTLC